MRILTVVTVVALLFSAGAARTQESLPVIVAKETQVLVCDKVDAILAMFAAVQKMKFLGFGNFAMKEPYHTSTDMSSCRIETFGYADFFPLRFTLVTDRTFALRFAVGLMYNRPDGKVSYAVVLAQIERAL